MAGETGGSNGASSSNQKNIIKIIFVAFSWGALIAYSVEFQNIQLWEASKRKKLLICIFAFILLTTMFGHLAAYLENFPMAIIFLLAYTAFFILNVIFMHLQHKDFKPPIILGSCTWLAGFGFIFVLYGSGVPLGCPCGGGGGGASGGGAAPPASAKK